VWDFLSIEGMNTVIFVKEKKGIATTVLFDGNRYYVLDNRE
jgi:hypothetical protein